VRNRKKITHLWGLLLVLASADALAANPCPSLLAGPTAAELALSSEERVALLYSRLLTQYRVTVNGDEYLKFLEDAVKLRAYYAIHLTKASQFEMNSVFDLI